MAFDFAFTTLQDMRQLSQLIDFVHSQDLGYPGYHSWVEKTEAELTIGYKKAILAFSDGQLVADLIYQPHKGISSLLEIKNMRVHPNLRNRNFARFMIRQLEMEASGKYDALLGDIRADQPDIIANFYRWGYSSVANFPLYGDSANDVVVVKFLDQNNELVKQLTRKIEIAASLQARRN